jgi:hypothetical protein
VEAVVAVQTLLLRQQLPELTLRPGVSVVARVLSRGEGHGVLVIAGVPLTAQLPERVGAAGDVLRLSVADVTPERVTLQLEGTANAAPVAPPPPEARAGTRVTVEDPPRRGGTGGEERTTIALAFHSPALGRLDLRLELSGTRVHAAVEAAAGTPFELADVAAGRLQQGLHARTGLEADVRVSARREPLDLYA